MLKRYKNKILRLITLIAFFTSIISTMAIETSTREWIPMLVSTVAVGWLCLFGYANRYRLAGVREEK